MHTSVRGIIKVQDGIILIHRIKRKENGELRDYYVVPGGKMEKGETEEETVKREVFEEVGIKVKPTKLILAYDSKYDNSIQKFYACEYLEGEIGTGTGPEYFSKKYTGYIMPEVVKIEGIRNINLVPKKIKELILGEKNEL